MPSGYALELELDAAGKITGECETKGFENQLEIESWSWGCTNPGELGQHQGTDSMGQDFVLTMKSCTASPKLFQACATGDPIKKFKLTCYKAVSGKQPEVYMTWEIKEAFISTYQTGGSGGEAMDSYSINFKTITSEYKEQKAGKAPETKGEGGFNFKSQTKQ